MPNKIIIFLKLLPVILVLIYGIFDFLGIVDQVTGQKNIERGIERLIYGKGFPESWIYDNETEFDSLNKLIMKNTYNSILNQDFFKKNQPWFITVAGYEDNSIKGLPSDYFYDDLYIRSDVTPVLTVYRFGEEGQGKAAWVGTIGDLKKWSKSRKDSERFWILVILISLLSIINLALERFQHKKSACLMEYK